MYEGNEITLPYKAIAALGLSVAGPFHSMEMTVKHSLTRHMICLVSGSGKSVSDSVIRFQKSRPGYWKTLTVIQLCGRNKGAAPTTKQINDNASIYFQNGASNKSCTNSNSIKSSSILNPQDLVRSIENSIESNHSVSNSTDEIESQTRSVYKDSNIQVHVKLKSII